MATQNTMMRAPDARRDRGAGHADEKHVWPPCAFSAPRVGGGADACPRHRGDPTPARANLRLGQHGHGLLAPRMRAGTLVLSSIRMAACAARYGRPLPHLARATPLRRGGMRAPCSIAAATEARRLPVFGQASGCRYPAASRRPPRHGASATLIRAGRRTAPRHVSGLGLRASLFVA